jgi:hypothetical protein
LGISHIRRVNDHNLATLYNLTPSQGQVLAWLADKIHQETGTWYHSGTNIARAVNRARETCDLATKRLCELGILSRDRLNRETPYTYRFVWECPPECSEASHMVERKPDNPLRENPTRGREKSSQHIREPIKEIKEEVKQTAPATSFCNCEKVEQGTIHLEECPGYLKLQESQAWEITKERNGSEWDFMSSRRKQFAHLESLAEMNKRKESKSQEQTERLAKFELDFEESYKVKSQSWGELSPPWKQYLKEVSSPTADRPFTGIGHNLFIRCAYYTEQGVPVPAGQAIKNKLNPCPEIQVPGLAE